LAKQGQATAGKEEEECVCVVVMALHFICFVVCMSFLERGGDSERRVGRRVCMCVCRCLERVLEVMLVRAG
jgi:hypothetical protein